MGIVEMYPDILSGSRAIDSLRVDETHRKVGRIEKVFGYDDLDALWQCEIGIPAVVDRRERISQPRFWGFAGGSVIPDIATVTSMQLHSAEDFNDELTLRWELFRQRLGWVYG